MGFTLNGMIRKRIHSRQYAQKVMNSNISGIQHKEAKENNNTAILLKQDF